MRTRKGLSKQGSKDFVQRRKRDAFTPWSVTKQLKTIASRNLQANGWN